MSKVINNRLIGTIIVVIAGIILLPSILDGEKQSRDNLKKIPEKPVLEDVVADVSFPDKSFESQLPSTELPQTDDVETDRNGEVINWAEPVESGEVVSETDVVTVATVSKPISFGRTAESTRATTPATTGVKKASVDKKSVATNSSSKKQNEHRKPVQHDFVDSGWIIRLGAFGNKKNVQALVSKLKNKGYVVFTRPVKSSSRELTQVLVGPELDKAKIEKMNTALKKLTGLSGKVVKFDPVK